MWLCRHRLGAAAVLYWHRDSCRAGRGGAGRGGARPHVQTVTGLPARPAGAGDASPGAGRSTRLQNPLIGRGLDFAMGEVASLSLKTLLPAMVKSADAITGTRQDVIQLTRTVSLLSPSRNQFRSV